LSGQLELGDRALKLLSGGRELLCALGQEPKAPESIKAGAKDNATIPLIAACRSSVR
jgi:hypothetical protein